MRIGITGGGATVDRIVEQAIGAERDGFSSIWYASAVAGDTDAHATTLDRVSGACRRRRLEARFRAV